MWWGRHRGWNALVHSKRSLELLSYTTAADKEQRDLMQELDAGTAFKAIYFCWLDHSSEGSGAFQYSTTSRRLCVQIYFTILTVTFINFGFLTYKVYEFLYGL